MTSQDIPQLTDQTQAAHELLESALAEAKTLQLVTAAMIEAPSVNALAERLLDATVGVMRSDFASMQLLHRDRNQLQLVAQRGFNPAATVFWEWVRADSMCTCGAALKLGRRVIASDLEGCEFQPTGADLDTYRATGIRSVQSTPLIGTQGQLLGMVSNHWRTPHQPTEEELRLLDAIAAQAALMIERREGERDRHRMEKLAATAQFGSALAHEINNPMQALTNLLELISYKMANDANGLALAEMAAAELQKITTITQHMMALHRDTLAPVPVQITEVLDDVLEMLAPRMELKGVRATVKPGKAGPIQAFPGEIRQLFASLLSNTIETLPRGSRIVLHVSMCRDWRRPDGHRLRVTIADNGNGTEGDVLKRMFEPFAVSKERRLSGLSLWVAVNIVSRHRGAIRVRSSRKPHRHGSTIAVFLPHSATPHLISADGDGAGRL